MRSILLLLAVSAFGCATVDPGHRGLYFDVRHGLQHEVLTPGRHWTGPFDRIEDFDVTYSTKDEDVQTTSAEGLQLNLRLAVIYRPIISELYNLDTEIGTDYYREVIGPEFRSAARGVFARHSYLELLRKNEQIEDEIEADLRRRTTGKHVEIASVTLEEIQYAPEIARAIRDKLAAEQDAGRQKTLLENEAMRSKIDLEHKAEQARISADSALRAKQQEAEVAKAQATLDKIRAESEAERRVIQAKAVAEESKLVARAKAEQARAENQALTPLAVMLRGYKALEALGGENTHILIGDWSHVPNFLFPPFAASGGKSGTERRP
ncbi:MAG: SPFH domain-containing protein [Polyangia bacterium]|jgi:regulator of protease activity HflC (stomatin/prohibitin superfamily)